MRWLALALLLFASPALAANPTSNACVAIIGDTQVKVNSDAQRAKDDLGKIVTSIISNRVDPVRGDIQLVLQPGDAANAFVFDGCPTYPPASNCTAEQQAQMVYLGEQFNRFDGPGCGVANCSDAEIPFFSIGGNHDLDRYHSDVIGHAHYGPSGLNRSWVRSVNVFGAPARDTHSWSINPSFGGGDLLVVGLRHTGDGGRPSDWDSTELAWAQAEIDALPSSPVFIITHWISALPQFTPGDTDGRYPLVSNSRVHFYAWGHSGGLGLWLAQGTTIKTAAARLNEQFEFDGGTSWYQLLCFEPAANAYSLRTIWGERDVAHGGFTGGFGFGLFDAIGTWDWSDRTKLTVEKGYTKLKPATTTGGYIGDPACLHAAALDSLEMRNDCERKLDTKPREWKVRDENAEKLPGRMTPGLTTPAGSAASARSWWVRSNQWGFEWLNPPIYTDPLHLQWWYKSDGTTTDDTQLHHWDGTDGIWLRNINSSTVRLTVGPQSLADFPEPPVGSWRNYAIRWGSAAEPIGTGGLVKFYDGDTERVSPGTVTLDQIQPLGNAGFYLGWDGTTVTHAAGGEYHEFVMLKDCTEDCRCWVKTCGAAGDATQASREASFGVCGVLDGPQDVTDCTTAPTYPPPRPSLEGADISGGSVQ